MKVSYYSAALLAATTLLSAPLTYAESSTASTAASATLVEQQGFTKLLKQAIRPLYQELAQASTQLVLDSKRFCQQPTAASLQTLRTQWGQTMLAWQRTDALLFGPSIAEQIDFRINFNPPKKSIINGLLTGTATITVDSVRAAGVGAQGLSSLEFVLFDRSLADTDLLASFVGDKGQPRCAYLVAVSTLTDEYIQSLATNWQSQASETLFAQPQAFIDTLIGKLYQSSEKIVISKLRKPLDIPEQHYPNAQALEAWRSGYSLKIIQANLEGMQRLLEQGGFLEWLAQQSTDAANTRLVANKVRQQLRNTLQAASLEADPVTLIETKQTEPLMALYQQALTLQLMIKQDVAKVAGAKLGFNDNDGD